MTTAKGRRQAREALDLRLTALGPASRYAVPGRGWIRAIRDALGMTASDLAGRMGISGASVRSLEEKELSGGIRLSSLKRAAEAMECTLVYAFVPNQTLTETVERQARLVHELQSVRTWQTMALEAQESELPHSSEADQLASIIDAPGLWSRVGTRG